VALKILRRTLFVVRLSTVAFLLSACGGADTPQQHGLLGIVTSAVGLNEAAPKPAEVLDVVVDASEGSPGSIATVETTVNRALVYAAERPGSEVRVWALGLELSDTRLLASVRSAAPKRRGERARKAEAQRFMDASKPLLLQAVRPIFEHPATKQSPIAEGIARVAYSRAPARIHRKMIVITDAREVSGGPLRVDFECDKKLPDAKTFVATLHRNALLTAHTLDNTDVYFAFVALEEIPKRGCPVTLARAQQIELVWRAACAAAGATTVSFTTDGPQLDTPSVRPGGAL
jgi:hypothetical protein